MQNEEIDLSPELADFPDKYMTTLPDFFNDTVGKSLTIENTNPKIIIEILGDFLGIADYKRNLASFWFLDTLALQVLRSNEFLDNHSRVIFISWLVGEMKLIRDNKFPRDKFFEEMEILFTTMARKVAQGAGIPHWNQITFDAAGLESENEEEEELSRQRDLSASNDLEPKTRTATEKESNDETIKSSSFLNPKDLLDIIIRSTYDMYAGEVRYALVYAVFVEPIKIQVHNLPFNFRDPRPTRPTDSKGTGNFNLRLQNALQKLELGGRKNVTGKSKVQKLKKEITKEYPAQPPNSLLEENLLLAKRSFLLPLIESKEAAATFDLYREAA